MAMNLIPMMIIMYGANDYNPPLKPGNREYLKSYSLEGK